MQCDHEDSCSQDPCQPLALPQDREVRNLLDCEVPDVPVASVPWLDRIAVPRCAWFARPADPPDRLELPYAPSDRPLLI